MEKFILGLFSEQLENYIEGFHKEQVNANLLRGKGEISDVRVKVKPVNDILKSYTSLVELSSIYISKLSFNMTSLRNIKKAPIEIFIDEVHIVLVEPLEHSGMNEAAWPELSKQIVERAKKQGSYGLIERIQDNITLDINRVYITFQPMGNFKTRKSGKWTPPAISVVLNHLRYVSVDEYGEEGSPDEVWRHNTRAGKVEASLRQQGKDIQNDRAFRHRTLMIYKKVTMEVSIAVGYRSEGMSAKESFMSSKALFVDLPFQSHICVHRRIRNNAILAVQIDASLMTLEIEINNDVLPILIHAMAGIQACVKCRAYKDPFANKKEDSSAKTVKSSSHDAEVSYDIDQEIKIVEDTDILTNAYESDESISGTEDNSVNYTKSMEDKEIWPIVVLPAGLVIFEKIAFSFSVHHIGLRINYPSDLSGYLQIRMKGLVLELISPKTISTNLGGYIQISLPYIHVQETHLGITRQIMHGGHCYNNSFDQTFDQNKETTVEEMFPIFEQTYVRSDPNDLRCNFPVQAFGLKVSIDALGKEHSLASTRKLFLSNEIGINDFDVAINMQALLRLKKCFEQGASKVDQRWFTGAWSSEAGISEAEILHYISQPPKGSFISALDLQDINLTSRMRNSKITLLPLDTSNLKSGTMTLSVSEMELVLSNSLPRMFLSEEIPIHDEGGTVLSFPNDREDFIYGSINGLHQIARVQVTLIGVAAIFQPSLPVYNATESTRIFNAKNLTFLGSHDTSTLDIKGAKKHLFFSSKVEAANINVDFDVISSMFIALCSFKDYEPFNISSGDQKNLLDLISAFNITNRFSANQISFRLLRQQLHSDEDTELIKALPVVDVLRLTVEDIEIGMQLFLGKNGCSEKCYSAKGWLGRTILTTKTAHYFNTGSGILQADHADSTLISFGSAVPEESQHAFSFRLEKAQIPGSLNAEVVVTSGFIQIMEELDAVLLDIVDSILRQGWKFPPSPLLQERTTDVNTDWRHDLLSSFFFYSPDKINFVNLSIQMNSMTLHLPLHGKSEKSMTLVCDYLHFYSGYLGNNILPDIHKKIWNTFYRDNTPGFHHVLSSQQKVLTNDILGAARELINAFTTTCYLHPHKLHWSIDECSLSVEELNIVHELKNTLTILQSKFVNLHQETKVYLAEVKPQSNVPFDLIESNASSPAFHIYAASNKDISRTKSLLSEAKEFLLSNDSAALKPSNDSDEVLQLRKSLFCAEMERLAALSLVSHQMSGFISMSGTAISGQRFVSATTFWRFYAVLRDSHLVIFKDTSQTKPFALMTLCGASIKSLKGSGARSMYNRAFAIIENTGKETFFLAPSFAEYEKWISALRTSCGEKNTVTLETIESRFQNNVQDVAPNIDARVRPSDLRNAPSASLSFEDHEISGSKEHGERNPGTDIFVGVDAPSTKSEDEIEDNQNSNDFKSDIDGDANKRGAKFRDRMAKIKSSVKNNVKNMNENVKHMKMEKHTMNPVFARRDSHPSRTGSVSISTPLKLKQVKATNAEPQIKERLKIDSNQELCRMPGVWICTVSIEGLDHTSEYEKLEERLSFAIHLSRKGIGNGTEGGKYNVVKSLFEILNCFTAISTILVAVQNDPAAAGLDRDGVENYRKLFSQVLSSGSVLCGLLTLLEKGDTLDFDYIGMALSTFFEGVFANIVPTMVLKTVQQFFDMLEIDWDCNITRNNTAVESDTVVIADLPSSGKLYNLLSNCEFAIARSERQIARLQMVAYLPHSQYRHHLPTKEHASKHMFTIRSANKIIFNALASVMIERDDAHSALVSSSVLHTHELELNHKRIEALESKLKVVEGWSNRFSAPGAAFFLGQETIPDINSLTKIEKQMIQNIEVELMELCRQLSHAISARVTAEMEIVRVKELSRIESEVHKSEQDRMEKELEAMRLKAKEDSQKLEASELEAQKWKESFEALLRSDSAMQ